MKDCLYCKKCGGFIEYNRRQILLSSPPKYNGKCKDCGNHTYGIMKDVDSALIDPKAAKRQEGEA
jgi:hypothetical protein